MRPSRSKIRWAHVETTLFLLSLPLSFLGCDIYSGNKLLLEFLFKCGFGVLYARLLSKLEFMKIHSEYHTLQCGGGVNEFVQVIFIFCTGASGRAV